MKKTLFIITVLILLIIAFLYFKMHDNAPAPEPVTETPKTDTTAPKKNLPEKTLYESRRKRAFQHTPEQLGISVPTNKSLVYGVIMDWDMGKAVASTIAYGSGDASVYMSSGASVIGGGKHPNVSSTAKDFVKVAQGFLDNATAIDSSDRPLPNTREVRFYLLTNKGTYMLSEEVKNFENLSSPLLKLFEAGNNLLTELRKTSEKNETRQP